MKRLTGAALALGLSWALVLPGCANAATADPFSGKTLYVDPHSAAKTAVSSLQRTHPWQAAEIAKIASRSQAIWYGDWTPAGTLTSVVAARMAAARAAHAMPVVVAYDLPERDCHGLSGGGATSPAAYQSWIRAFAAGLGSTTAAVIVEPDALAQLDCLSPADQSSRLALLRYAVTTLATHPRLAVYLDAGHSGWISSRVMANRLRSADVAAARGFSLNVSNFDSTSVETSYGRQVAALTGGKHFVIDTSRNGRGSDGQWCNPPGRALGHPPSTAPGLSGVDALLWIKRPGESDGSCNGGPAAGSWWTSYAVGLAQRASW